MAVQAQYPSNVLLLDRAEHDRNKSMDCGALHGQSHPPPIFLDHQSYFLNGGGSNRKRGREAGATAGAANQQQERQQPSAPRTDPPSLISLSQLHPHGHGNQHRRHHQLQSNSFVSTGLRLSVEGNLQSRPDHQQQDATPLSDELAAQIKHHSDDLDRLLRSQAEHLQRTVADTTRRHYRALAAAAEESAARKLREREAELEKAARRNADLETRVERLRAEAAALQAKARLDEATAVSLQAQLHQANADRAAAAVEDPAGSDEESACVDPRRERKTEREEDEGRKRSAAGGSPSCRGCGGMAATVVVLPCRHLCVCRFCEPAVQACPVCFCVKSATVEVYLS